MIDATPIPMYISCPLFASGCAGQQQVPPVPVLIIIVFADAYNADKTGND